MAKTQAALSVLLLYSSGNPPPCVNFNVGRCCKTVLNLTWCAAWAKMIRGVDIYEGYWGLMTQMHMHRTSLSTWGGELLQSKTCHERRVFKGWLHLWRIVETRWELCRSYRAFDKTVERSSCAVTAGKWQNKWVRSITLVSIRRSFSASVAFYSYFKAYSIVHLKLAGLQVLE